MGIVISPLSFWETQGGWIMPTALIDASNCSSIAGGTGVRRRLFGSGRRVRGLTLRISAIPLSCALQARRGKGAQREAKRRTLAAVDGDAAAVSRFPRPFC